MKLADMSMLIVDAQLLVQLDGVVIKLRQIIIARHQFEAMFGDKIIQLKLKQKNQKCHSSMITKTIDLLWADPQTIGW